MNFQLVRGKQKKSSHICSQLAPDYLPPIWSLSSSHLITGSHWICQISFHISFHICSKWQCSEPQYHAIRCIWSENYRKVLNNRWCNSTGHCAHVFLCPAPEFKGIRSVSFNILLSENLPILPNQTWCDHQKRRVRAVAQYNPLSAKKQFQNCHWKWKGKIYRVYNGRGGRWRGSSHDEEESVP